eukprot:CAMPEP_0179001824 /NCGR_PEP_ID=MMETSP0795-20121207/11612_1 /TAXON_ID=88552 /ORGANISM="Amoebophrya sp., Strain Ameob2" /LENGTH=625 /DNA_ID=CAMNT_0020695315 /DNA_START=137 /DNA_END=2015 /DNA_ORIENTATION=-
MLSRELRDLLVKCAPHWNAKNVFQASRKLVRLGITERSHLACFLGGPNAKTCRLNKELERLGEKGFSKRTLNALKHELEEIGLSLWTNYKKSFEPEPEGLLVGGIGAARRSDGATSSVVEGADFPGAPIASAKHSAAGAAVALAALTQPVVGAAGAGAGGAGRTAAGKLQLHAEAAAAAVPGADPHATNLLPPGHQREQFGSSSSSSQRAPEHQQQHRQNSQSHKFAPPAEDTRAPDWVVLTAANNRQSHSTRNNGRGPGAGCTSSRQRAKTLDQIRYDAQHPNAALERELSFQPQLLKRKNFKTDPPRNMPRVRDYETGGEGAMPTDALSMLSIVKEGEKAMALLLRQAKNPNLDHIKMKMERAKSPEQKETEALLALDPMRYCPELQEEEEDELYSEDFEGSEDGADEDGGSPAASARRNKAGSRSRSRSPMLKKKRSGAAKSMKKLPLYKLDPNLAHRHDQKETPLRTPGISYPDRPLTGTTAKRMKSSSSSSRAQSPITSTLPRTPGTLTSPSREGRDPLAMYHHRSPTGIEPSHIGPSPAGMIGAKTGSRARSPSSAGSVSVRTGRTEGSRKIRKAYLRGKPRSNSYAAGVATLVVPEASDPEVQRKRTEKYRHWMKQYL